MLDVRAIHTYYDDAHILRGVSLQVKQGQAVSILGRNGAGKTTTIYSIAGLTPVRSGAIWLHGREITSARPHLIARAGVGLTPQGHRLFTNLTVRENVLLGAASPRPEAGVQTPWSYERIVELFPRICERENHRADQLSGGEQQMVAIARALMTNPTLLLLDEPSEGLAPLLVREIWQVLGELKAQGQSILLVEQNLALATQLADHVYVMSKGEVVFEGSPSELTANQAVTRQYLGV